MQVETGDVYIIGGAHSHYHQDSTKRVTRWNYADGTFTPLKTTIQQRQSHACATFKSAKHGIFFLLVVSLDFKKQSELF